jgi:hypothetical protein
MSKDSGDFLFFWIRRIKFAYLFGQKTSGPWTPSIRPVGGDNRRRNRRWSSWWWTRWPASLAVWTCLISSRNKTWGLVQL